MQDNIPAVIQVMRFIYDNIMYAELNTKITARFAAMTEKFRLPRTSTVSLSGDAPVAVMRTRIR